MSKILVATEKPFAKVAIEGMRQIIEDAGYTFALLERYTDTATLWAAVSDAEGLIVRSDKVTPELIAAAPNLKVVVRAGAGYDNINLQACTDRGIVAMNTPGQNSNAVAELAIGLMLFAARNHFEPGTGTELKGKKLGIHAYGNVGRLVAALAKGFGMDVYAFDPFIPAEKMEAEGIKSIATVEELYRTCQYVSVHIPATPETKRSINYALISSMPQGGTIVNTARAEVVDEEGLFKAITERTDLRYFTDVAPDCLHRLVNNVGARVFATSKKMGAETAEANINAGIAAARQAVDYLKNGNNRFQVNR
ncbi:MAG: 3-phosphoglycerate dehydrogenase [Bacteroidales bacterium]|nr:3-phosphoglycerate dehydrogenase [Bacteroidales bacterium]MBQ7213819.1 3-phosphoglycerate dehydrogenase [Bacteroidales bacterium]MCR5715188.1 3-phosphoglycerate dehydrogenase [Bacteroidales bacterium]